MKVIVSSSPFGSSARTRALLALQLLTESYARELAPLLELSLSSVQKALQSLERDGLVAARAAGRTRLYRLSPRALPRGVRWSAIWNGCWNPRPISACARPGFAAGREGRASHCEAGAQVLTGRRSRRRRRCAQARGDPRRPHRRRLRPLVHRGRLPIGRCRLRARRDDHGRQPRRGTRAAGFKRQRDRYVHAAVPFYVEFPRGPLGIGEDDQIRPIWKSRRGARTLALSPTDACRDRLAAFYHWNDRQSLAVAVTIAVRNRVALQKVRTWSRAEGNERGYAVFAAELRSARRVAHRRPGMAGPLRKG